MPKKYEICLRLDESGSETSVCVSTCVCAVPKASQIHGIDGVVLHYLYILGKIEKREYPPRMTPQMRKDVMQFEQLREQFAFLRENALSGPEDIASYEAKAEETLSGLIKQRTILNVRKKRRQKLYTALADVEVLAEAQKRHGESLPGMEDAVKRYTDAVSVLEKSGVDRDTLVQEKAGLYNDLAGINREIRAVRKELKLCAEIHHHKIGRDIQIGYPHL